MLRRFAAPATTLAILAACATSAGSAQPRTLVAAPTTDKVLVFVIENRSLAQVKSGAPKLWALGQTYSYATNFKAITHPSLPNYIAMTSGSTQGIKDDAAPSSHKLKVPNVFSGAWANGRTAKVVADGMGTTRCRTTNAGKFAVRHTAFPYYVNDRALCIKYQFDQRYFNADVASGKLANVEFDIPSNAHNAHDGSLATADTWINDRIKTAITGPDWKAGRLTIVVTADEDSKKDGNLIYTAVLHPSLSHVVVTTPLTLYSLSGLLSDFGHSPRLLNARTAPDMAAAFGLVVN
jgi:phosphatidylinositol-3-phosphatase